MKYEQVWCARSWCWPPAAILPLVLVGTALAAEPAAPTAKPLLWRIEGETPSYLFGTIHLPDARVVVLPEVVQRAFDGADAVFTEVELDPANQLAAMSKVTLPAGQDLKTLAGEELFSRFVRAFTAGLGADLPPAAVEAMGAQFSRMKPWAAMVQVGLVEYLPDLMAGRQPMDVMLYSMATEMGKETGGLETVDEQISYFEALTTEEQVRLLKSTLDELDEAKARGQSLTKPLVEAYLAGDTHALLQELSRSMEKERELKAKLLSKLLTERNVILAERIVAKRAAHAGKVCFFAVGALHIAGEEGIPDLLRKKGLSTTRLTAVEALATPLELPVSK